MKVTLSLSGTPSEVRALVYLIATKAAQGDIAIKFPLQNDPDQYDVVMAPDPLEILIEDLDLTVRSYNTLARAEIRKVGELVVWSAEDLLQLGEGTPSGVIGQKQIEELRRVLQPYGLKLKGDQ